VIVPLPAFTVLPLANVIPTPLKEILLAPPDVLIPSFNVSEPPAPEVVSVTAAGTVMPATVPKSSVREPTVNGFVDALVICNAPDDREAATVENTLACVNVIAPAPRNNKFDPLVARLITPD